MIMLIFCSSSQTYKTVIYSECYKHIKSANVYLMDLFLQQMLRKKDNWYICEMWKEMHCNSKDHDVQGWKVIYLN